MSHVTWQLGRRSLIWQFKSRSEFYSLPSLVTAEEWLAVATGTSFGFFCYTLLGCSHHHCAVESIAKLMWAGKHSWPEWGSEGQCFRRNVFTFPFVCSSLSPFKKAYFFHISRYQNLQEDPLSYNTAALPLSRTISWFSNCIMLIKCGSRQ